MPDVLVQCVLSAEESAKHRPGRYEISVTRLSRDQTWSVCAYSFDAESFDDAASKYGDCVGIALNDMRLLICAAGALQMPLRILAPDCVVSIALHPIAGIVQAVNHRQPGSSAANPPSSTSDQPQTTTR